MSSCKQLKASVWSGIHDETLARLYTLDGTQNSLKNARDCVVHVITVFQNTFSKNEVGQVVLFSGPGRTEIGGNHTDH